MLHELTVRATFKTAAISTHVWHAKDELPKFRLSVRTGKMLICCGFPTKSALGFTEDGPNKEKTSIEQQFSENVC